MNDWNKVPANSRGDPWFTDGNIVLLSDSDPPETILAFKVHRGVVARHSEVFQTMFDLPPPMGEPIEMLEGCPVVHMIGDRANELGDFIKALYDGAVFQHRDISDFFYVTGILRLATKYLVTRLREQAIRHLTETWPYTLQGHDAMVDRALSSPSIGNASYPYVHPLHVLNASREANVSVTIPAVLYFLSIYPLADILRADHPKLLVVHPSAPSKSLVPDALKDYTLMYQHRLQLMLEFIHKTCGERSEDPNCAGVPRQCKRGFAGLTYQLATALSVRTGVFHNMLQATNWIDAESTVCSTCKRAFRRDVLAQREKWWRELPAVVGLPDWEALIAQDLSLTPVATSLLIRHAPATGISEVV
ncbi:hypothetical protein K488DRAFT_45007 [Vararia minispora EC-137]|uniref:Uncharacterized protein n=1 Tax=Vararia minispora EC-137 TaxID=1314806 RepID=A0ACB8QTC5_9AGAM|nr:hypothetical protein K488DRAFT_45007 [Vararia minispora EC-137]